MMINILVMEGFCTLDREVLGVFFALMIGIVIWFVFRKEETFADYFLAGKDAGWIAIGASIFSDFLLKRMVLDRRICSRRLFTIQFDKVVLDD